MPRRVTEYTYDSASGRWRKGGRYAAAPSRELLRLDSAGRPIDARGRRVPAAAIAAAPATPARARKRRESPSAGQAVQKPASKKRARKGGPAKPAKPVKPSRTGPVAKKKRGVKAKARASKAKKPKPRTRPKAGAKPKPKRVRKPKKAVKRRRFVDVFPRVPTPPRPVARVRVAPITYIPEGAAVSRHTLLSSTFENKKEPDQIAGVFTDLMERKAYKQGIALEDVSIYRIGINFINVGGVGNPGKVSRAVRRFARDNPLFDFQFNGDSVHVWYGSDQSAINAGKAHAILHAAKNAFVDIYWQLFDLWDGDVGWFLEAENDDLEGGS